LLNEYLERFFEQAERIAIATERIATALEADAGRAGKDRISANDVRAANRATLLLLCDQLGVTTTFDASGLEHSDRPTDWLRNRCLEAVGAVRRPSF
jgi:hypothetical protein